MRRADDDDLKSADDVVDCWHWPGDQFLQQLYWSTYKQYLSSLSINK